MGKGRRRRVLCVCAAAMHRDKAARCFAVGLLDTPTSGCGQA